MSHVFVAIVAAVAGYIVRHKRVRFDVGLGTPNGAIFEDGVSLPRLPVWVLSVGTYATRTIHWGYWIAVLGVHVEVVRHRA